MNAQQFFLVGAIALMVNCSFDAPRCVSDEECSEGSSCVYIEAFKESACLNPDPSNNATDGGGFDLGEDIEKKNPNNVEPDVVDFDVTNNIPDTPPTICTIDPFDSTCGDDSFEPRENRPGPYEITNDVVGCDNFGTDFQPISISVNAVLCSADDADWYKITYNPCDTRKRLNVRVMPGRECTGAEYDLSFGDYRCDDDNVRCTLKENGEREISLLLPRASENLTSFSWVVEDRRNAEFEYRMEVELVE